MLRILATGDRQPPFWLAWLPYAPCFIRRTKVILVKNSIRLQASSKITNTDPFKKFNLAISGSRHQCLFILGSAGAFNWHLLLHC